MLEISRYQRVFIVILVFLHLSCDYSNILKIKSLKNQKKLPKNILPYLYADYFTGNFPIKIGILEGICAFKKKPLFELNSKFPFHLSKYEFLVFLFNCRKIRFLPPPPPSNPKSTIDERECFEVVS